MTAITTTNPSFEPPGEESDNEIWLLRAPAHVDVSALLNGVTIDVNSQSLKPSTTSNNILSRFNSDGSEYALAVGDASESENLRLLVPDSSDGGALVPYHPFQRQIHLTSVMASDNKNNADVQTDLILAPAAENALKPALDRKGNGSVDAMRLAYVPVPQRQGLKRRWAMPGGKIGEQVSQLDIIYSVSNKKAHVVEETPKKKDATGSDDEPQTSAQTGSGKKEKKKKEKKSKKSAKKAKK